jgi:hypothetical protein
MLKKLSKDGVLVFAAMVLLAAFAMPSMTWAASWGAVGTTHDLDQVAGNGLAFTTTDGTIGWGCAGFSLHAFVASAAALTVQSGTFTNCMGTGAAGTPCTTTLTGTFPWRATGLSTTNIQIHNVNVHIRYENTPGNATNCPTGGMVLTLTGTLASPNHTHWNATTRTAAFVNATGLSGDSALGPKPVRIDGTITDRAHTLVLS